MIRPVAIGVAIAVAVGVAASSVQADEPSAVDVDAVAVSQFDEGRRALDEKRFEDAVVAFRASLARQSSPNTRLLLAKALLEEGKIGSAYTLFKAAAREAQDRATLTHEPRYIVTRDLANKELIELEPRVPRLTIAVPGALPKDFLVTVNGARAESSTWGIAIEQNPGHVVVEAHGRRVQPFHFEADLHEGDVTRVDVALARVPTAQITVVLPVLPAGVALAVDDSQLGPELIATPIELDPGAHHVDVRAPGYETFTWARRIADGESLRIEAMLHPDPHLEKRGTPLWLMIASGSAAVLATGIGTGLIISAKHSDNEESAKDPLLRSDARESSIQDRARLGTGALITAGCLAVATAVLVFTTHRGGR